MTDKGLGDCTVPQCAANSQRSPLRAHIATGHATKLLSALAFATWAARGCLINSRAWHIVPLAACVVRPISRDAAGSSTRSATSLTLDSWLGEQKLSNGRRQFERSQFYGLKFESANRPSIRSEANKKPIVNPESDASTAGGKPKRLMRRYEKQIGSRR